MTTDGVFDIVRRVREKSRIPLVFLTYLNPVFHYGYDRFFEKCGELSVDGIIIPDLPFEEKGELAPAATAHGVDLISMIAPVSYTHLDVYKRQVLDAADTEGFQDVDLMLFDKVIAFDNYQMCIRDRFCII